MFFNHISKNLTKIATIGSVLVMGGGLLGGCGATGLNSDAGSSTSKVKSTKQVKDWGFNFNFIQSCIYYIEK